MSKYAKCLYIHITSFSHFPEILHVQLDTPGKMNTLEVTSITLEAHVTLLLFQKHNNMEFPTSLD